MTLYSHNLRPLKSQYSFDTAKDFAHLINQTRVRVGMYVLEADTQFIGRVEDEIDGKFFVRFFNDELGIYDEVDLLQVKDSNPERLFLSIKKRMTEPTLFMSRVILNLPNSMSRYSILNTGDKIIFKAAQTDSETKTRLNHLTEDHDYFSLMITPFRKLYIDVSTFKFTRTGIQFFNKIFQGFTERSRVNFFLVNQESNQLLDIIDAYNVDYKTISPKQFVGKITKTYKI